MIIPMLGRLQRTAPKALLMAVLAASSLAGPAYAQPVAPPLWTRDSIYSSALGEMRYLRIALPAEYDARHYATQRYPVLIVLDAAADIAFAATVANARALAGTNAPAIPRMVIVGIEPGSSRFRDMTLPATDGLPRKDGGGGASAFLRFLSTELRPYIASHYRTDSLTVLSGHSLGGFFARWAFGAAPSFVNAAIALSPSPLETERVLDAIVARGRPGRLVMVTGTAERTMTEHAQSFAAALRARSVSGLAFQYEQIADVSHDHTGPFGIIPGLRFIFRPVSLAPYQVEFTDDSDPLRTFSAAFDSTRTAYLQGARELGLPPRLPLTFLTSQSRWYQSATQAPLLMRLCQEMIGSYPTLWHGFECAGDAHARMGRAVEASAEYRRAVEAARAAGDSATAERLSRKALNLQKPAL